ncbi:MAG: PQQ-dependent sugar dehydrogenase [Pseudomonadales bacterium]
MRIYRLLILLGSLCTGAALAQAYKIETVASGLNHPWSIAFLPEGGYLVAMRAGELRAIGNDGEVGPAFKNTPSTFFAGQGGYFDVLLDRDYKANKTLYLSFAHGNAKANATRVVRAGVGDNALENVTEIFSVTPAKDTSAHYGGRLLQMQDGSLLLTSGDGFQYREAAQDRFSQLGKLLRFNPDGSLPPDNPYSDGQAGDPAVWSYGHRNPQGLARDAGSGKIYLHEHGPRGGDEINAIEAGANYGWPAVTHGINYSGALISPFTSAPGMQDPMHYWVPSIAPSGFTIYRGDAFPDWQGNFFVGALVDREVRMLSPVKDGKMSERAIFSEIDQRIRDVREGPGGYLYILTDGERGALLRIVPAAK